MLLSIVTTTRNKVGHLRAALHNVAAQTAARDDVEVVVVNDGSAGETAAALDALAERCRFTRLDTVGVGLAAARNLGVAASSGSAVLFMDDDIILGPGYLDTLTAAVREAPEAVHVGNLQNVHVSHVPALLEDVDRPDFRGFRALDDLCAFNSMFTASRRLFAGRHPGGGDEVHPAAWWAVSTGGNLCIPRTAFAAVGGFDENFKTWGPEDAELCFRLFRAGVRPRFNPGCRLYHLDHPRDTRATAHSLIRNANYMLKKHGKPPELMSYLELTGGIITLQEFNNRCAALNGLAPMEIEECYLTLKYVTTRNQLISWKRA